ncbi:hypothetical protein [Methylophilus methylotrophus]|uniref:hypothetical protein n=1 Tax=Methylophilus methylotrophus TaxID=17 RepID=UPI000F5AFAF3|nr:hypothetical protein [Methylophilus methylotrophus]
MKSNLAKNCMQLFRVLLCTMLLSSCYSTLLGRPLLGGPGYVEWQEEVKLNDGRVIVVTQKKKCSEAYDGNSYQTCIAREAWVTINLPEFSEKPIVWHEHLKAIVLNVHNKHLFIVGEPPTGLEFKQYGKPQPPYLGFVWKGSQWERVSFAEIPQEIYDVNMLIKSNGPNGIKYLKLQQKHSKEFNGDSRYRNNQKRIDPNFKVNI